MVAIHLPTTHILTQNPKLSIELLEDHIELRGSTSESSGTVLKGQLKLTLPQPTKLKHLHLNFNGNAKTWFLTPPTGTTHQNFNLINHDWNLITESDKDQLLQAGDHLYPFEVAIPGDLPSSLTTDHLELQYRFKATLHRNLWRSITAHKIVTISRIIDPEHPNLADPLVCSDSWNDQFHYELSAPTRIVPLGDTARCTLSLRMLNPAIKLKNVTGTVRQTVTLKQPILPSNVSQPLQVNLLLVRKQIKAPSEYDPNYNQQDPITMNFDLPIPKNRNHHPSPHPTDDSDIYSVDHYLKLNVVYRDQLDTIKSFSIKVPITLMEINWNQESCLPNYDQSRFTRVIEYSDNFALPPPSYEVASGTVTPTSGFMTPRSGFHTPTHLPDYDFGPMLNLPVGHATPQQPGRWDQYHHVPIALNNPISPPSPTPTQHSDETPNPIPVNEKTYLRY